MRWRGLFIALIVAVGIPALAGDLPSAGEAQIVGNPNFTPPPAKEGYSYPDCYCTDSTGSRVEMGEMACLRIGSREVLARCDMSLNNPTWRHMEGGCPGV